MSREEKNFNRPESQILKVLKGEVTEPIETKSHKPGQEGETVNTKIVKEGSGMVGLENEEDNKEWSGIFEHVIRTSRLASFLAKSLKKKGVEINPRVVLNTVLVSHSGRRQWDESRWYPDAVEDSENKKTKTDTDITLDLLKKAEISPTIVENVEAHDIKYPLEKIKDNWVAKVALYADYRTSQHVVPLKDRFDDLKKRAIPTGRVTPEELVKIENFFSRVEEEIFSILEDIKPEAINDDYPQAPHWENYIRRLYINDVEENIFGKYGQLKKQLEQATNNDEKEKIEAQIKNSFPENAWWGKYVRELYEKQGGKAYKPTRANVQTGIARAIDFFGKL